MTRRVILVRHATHAEVGRVLSGRSEIALNAAGKAEALALAVALDGTTFATMHSSPRRRARETASPLAVRRGMEVSVSGALDEVDFGHFAGRSFSEMSDDADWNLWNAERATARCPGGETMAEASRRVAAYLDALPSEAFPAVCVTHCDVIRGLVASLLGFGFERIFRFDCDPASRTTLDIGSDGGVRLVALNERVRA